MPNELTVPGGPHRLALGDAFMNVVLRVPSTDEHFSDSPAQRAKQIARSAARRSSIAAGSMALPPGVLGWLTVLPEMMAVWKIQTQMVSDIAGAYGQFHTLGREQMLRCLFKQLSAQMVRDLAVRVGERVVLQKLGAQLAHRVLTKGVARMVPLLGAVGVGAYAYADTMQVANNAMALFENRASTPEVFDARQ